MLVQLTYLQLTLAHSKGDSQDHAHFNPGKDHGNCDRANVNIAIKQGVLYALSVGIFTFDLGSTVKYYFITWTEYIGKILVYTDHLQLIGTIKTDVSSRFS